MELIICDSIFALVWISCKKKLQDFSLPLLLLSLLIVEGVEFFSVVETRGRAGPRQRQCMRALNSSVVKSATQLEADFSGSQPSVFKSSEV